MYIRNTTKSTITMTKPVEAVKQQGDKAAAEVHKSQAKNSANTTGTRAKEAGKAVVDETKAAAHGVAKHL